MFAQVSADALANARSAGLYQAQGPMSLRSAPTTAPTLAGQAQSYAAPAIGVALGAALGYFLVPKHATVAALGGAALGGLAGYLAFPAAPAAK